MELISKQLPDNHNIFNFGDKHEGSILSSQDGWDTLVGMIHSEYEGCSNNYGIEYGDDIEAIMVDDPRFSAEKLTEPFPLVQVKRAVEIRQAIKRQMLVKLDGNHPRKLWRFGDLTQEICSQLDVNYGTYTCKLSIRGEDGKFMYKIYATHGFRSVYSSADDPKRRKTNMELVLKRHLKFQAGDCAVMCKGHTHKLLVCKPESELYLTDDTRRIRQGYTKWEQEEKYIHPDARWYGNTGSFLKLFGKGTSGYAEIMELNPVPLGFLVLIVRDRQIQELRPIYLDI